MNISRIAIGLALAAGAMDLLTGLGLVTSPANTLKLMQVPLPGVEALFYLRFVGAFVASIGAIYLWAARHPQVRMRPIFGATLLPRIAAGSFTGVAVLLGSLPMPWLSVTMTDLTLVAVQLWLLGSWKTSE